MLLFGSSGLLCMVGGGTGMAEEQRIPIFDYHTGQVVLMEQVRKTEAEWKKLLTPEQFEITRQQGTERSCAGKFWDAHERGIYTCVGCGIALYRADTKFDSGTGWPSFWEPIDAHNVRYKTDTSFFMRRTEILCARCDAHLGHVFDDGPPPTHKRHCLNSAALEFVKQD